MGGIAALAFFAAAMGLYFGSLPFLPVAEAAAGLFTAPVFVLILTSLYQRQLPGWRRLLAVFAGSAGVVLLLEPDAPDFTWLHLMPVLGGAFYALANISARHLCADEPPLALVIGYFILIGIGGFLFSANLPDPALSWPASVWPALSGWQWLSLWVQALLTLLSVWLLVRSYQSGETSRLAISEYSFLGFAALFGWLIWGAIVSPSGWAGMVLVTLAGSLIIARSPSPPRPA